MRGQTMNIKQKIDEQIDAAAMAGVNIKGIVITERDMSDFLFEVGRVLPYNYSLYLPSRCQHCGNPIIQYRGIYIYTPEHGQPAVIL